MILKKEKDESKLKINKMKKNFSFFLHLLFLSPFFVYAQALVPAFEVYYNPQLSGCGKVINCTSYPTLLESDFYLHSPENSPGLLYLSIKTHVLDVSDILSVVAQIETPGGEILTELLYPFQEEGGMGQGYTKGIDVTNWEEGEYFVNICTIDIFLNNSCNSPENPYHHIGSFKIGEEPEEPEE